jgi:hypothetical protein
LGYKAHSSRPIQKHTACSLHNAETMLIPTFREITRHSDTVSSTTVENMLNQNDFIYMEKLVSNMIVHTTCMLRFVC